MGPLEPLKKLGMDWGLKASGWGCRLEDLIGQIPGDGVGGLRACDGNGKVEDEERDEEREEGRGGRRGRGRGEEQVGENGKYRLGLKDSSK